MTKTVLPAFWRVILCLTLFPLASAAMHSYEPNAARWLVFTLPYKTFPFTTTPSVSLLPPLYNVMVIGGTPPLNAQTNLTPNPLKDLTIIGVLFRLSEASGSTAKKKKNLKYDLINRKRSQYSMDYSKNCFPHYEESHFPGDDVICQSRAQSLSWRPTEPQDSGLYIVVVSNLSISNCWLLQCNS